MTDMSAQDNDLLGKEVLHVDSMKLQHHGTIVAVDSEWLYVRSSNPNVPPAEWHFKVKKELYPAIKFNRQESP
jgi:hypothetical protein